MALYGEKEWYFFSPRDRKHPNGVKPNRFAGIGYWKATGVDKPIGQPITRGIKKALVFFLGKATHGFKTNWIMHEYRLANIDRSATGRINKLRVLSEPLSHSLTSMSIKSFFYSQYQGLITYTICTEPPLITLQRIILMQHIIFTAFSPNGTCDIFVIKQSQIQPWWILFFITMISNYAICSLMTTWNG